MIYFRTFSMTWANEKFHRHYAHHFMQNTWFVKGQPGKYETTGTTYNSILEGNNMDSIEKKIST